MNILFLSPHFPRHYFRFCQALQRSGATVLAIANAPYDSLAPELRAALTEYYYVSSLEEYDSLLRGAGYFTHRYGKLDRIDSLNEHWLYSEARLRTDFNVPGPQLTTIDRIKRKSVMKDFFRQAQVPVAQGQLLSPDTSARAAAEAFIARYGYPVVVKPDIGVGAAHTFLLRNKAELEGFFAQPPATEYIMEEYIDGDIYSFDGLLDQAGTIVFSTGHQYSQGVMETVNDDLHISYWSLRQIPADIEQAGQAILQQLELKERFFHIEFFRRRSSDQLVALEINMRPPGGLTMDMFNFACDFDLYQGWADILVHNRFPEPWERKYHVLYAGRKAAKPYAHAHEQILAHCGDLLIHHEPIDGIFSPAIGNYGYLLRSPDLAPLFAARDYIQTAL